VANRTSRIEKRVDNLAEAKADVHADAQRILREYLCKAGLKNSAKRDCVLSVFLDTRDHLSTEELHRLVKAKDPSIGYTTVYRTLKLLAQCGLASEVEFHDGVARYEHSLYRRTHHHMVCTSCGDSIEFFAPEIEAVEARIGKKFRFAPQRHNFQIYGTCKTCREQQKQH
jgi:Fur family ferric uptake transcriptional regulator